ncbi:MAG: hypothetical protein IPP19_05060 [Verrucomicrobia bacterium]|nr:hypothetical protein [Verrucomicrobiota bacterium]
MTLSPKLKNLLAATCYTLGLALAVYLSLLKIYALPCIGPGNCQAILYSIYGSVLRIPVGVFGSLLWFGVIFIPDQNKRVVLLTLLALSTAAFMAIQFFVLRGFCLYCTLHAVAAWGALMLHRERPRFWVALLALTLAGGSFYFSRQYVATHAQADAARAPQLSMLANNPAALSFLGPIWPRNPTLILSLDCAACLDQLDELTRQSYADRPSGPAVYLKTNDTNRALTLGFIAAVLAQRDMIRRDAFLATATVLLSEKETALGNPAIAAARLAAIFPAAAGELQIAEKIVTAQSKALASAGLGETTPLLIPRDGRVKPFFKPEELFP